MGAHIYHMMMKSHLVEKEYLKVQGLFEEMKSQGIRPDVIVFTTFLKSITDQEKLLLHFEEMKATLQPDVFSYNTMIRAFANTLDSKRVLGFLEEMKRQNIEPNYHTWQIVFDLLTATEDMERIIQFYPQMQVAIQTMQNEKK